MRPKLTVSQLLAKIRENLIREPEFNSVLLQGEVSNLSSSRGGHLYFALKDEQSQIRCTMFAVDTLRMRFKLKDGQTVLARGQPSLYAPRGDLQFQVRALRLEGRGALYERLGRLKMKLFEEGLFDPDRRRPLPFFPVRVGIVTSLQGAVLHDVASTLRRRNRSVRLILAPASVQGENAPEEIALAIGRLQARVDCLIVARGGGSFEDLLAFNSEVVVRAVAASKVPIVSAVGHETDVTLCDLAADKRAPTPTAAAELVAPASLELKAELEQLRHRSRTSLTRQVLEHRDRLERLRRSPVLRYPQRLAEVQWQQLDDLRERLLRALKTRAEKERAYLEGLRRSPALRRPGYHLPAQRAELVQLTQRLQHAGERPLERARMEFSGLSARLNTLSPLRVLDSGYALVTDQQGRAVTQSQGRSAGETLEVRFADGRIRVRVEDAG